MILFSKNSLLSVLLLSLVLSSIAQADLPKGWHVKDKAKDGYQGISLDKAYDFVKGKKSQTVIVAVIDSGIDTTHEDLKSVLWVNAKEIPGNGIDDDKNGYTDDVNGWNFLGGKDGRNVKEDSYEVARVYHKYKAKFASLSDNSSLNNEDKELYAMWKKANAQINGGDKAEGVQLLMLRRTYDMVVKNDSILRKAMDKKTYTGTELNAFVTTTDDAKKAKNNILYFFKANNSLEMTNESFISEFGQYISGEERKAEVLEKAPKDYRGEIVKDNEADYNDRIYGNSDVMANTPFHGTHVAGIIGAVRKNGKGMDGIADNVRIMAIRAVPDGDEHDKDVALAIRYAVDNGAKIINMSFGKNFSPQKHWVDDAVKYAESKNVLLVHAAGNDGSNIDSVDNFPSGIYKKDNQASTTWITVGASGDIKGGGIVAGFSNYGKNTVDVFAPGVRIYSAVPGGNTYGDAQGTSMASPVVAGTAAFIWSYFPTLTAQQLKNVIEKSALPITVKVTTPGSGKSVLFTDISRTGGVLNAYEAAKLAAHSTGKAPVAQSKTTTPAKPSKKAKPVRTF